MNNLSNVSGEWRTLFAVFFGNHLEDLGELGKRFFTSGHQGVATGDGRNLCRPRAVFLAMQNRFVIVDLHCLSSPGFPSIAFPLGFLPAGKSEANLQNSSCRQENCTEFS